MPAQEDHERFSSIADELGLEDDDKDNFVSSAMERLGYVKKVVTDWLDSEPDESGGNGGDFFSSRRKAEKPRQQPRQAQRGRQPERKAGGWNQYQ